MNKKIISLKPIDPKPKLKRRVSFEGDEGNEQLYI